MKYLLFLLFLLFLLPSRVTSQVTTAQRISDSLTEAIRSGKGTVDVDTVIADFGIFGAIIATDTTTVFDTVVVLDVFEARGKASFFGAAPAEKCFLSHPNPPNAVTNATARAAYDASLQNCLTGYGLIGVPPP